MGGRNLRLLQDAPLGAGATRISPSRNLSPVSPRGNERLAVTGRTRVSGSLHEFFFCLLSSLARGHLSIRLTQQRRLLLLRKYPLTQLLNLARVARVSLNTKCTLQFTITMLFR